MIKLSIRYLVATAIAAEAIPSFWLWVTSPTDSVRVWYPSAFSYVGEHFLVWCLAILCLLSLLTLARRQPELPFSGVSTPYLLSVPAYVSLTLLLLAADVTASVLVASVSRSGDGVFAARMWYTQSLRDYLFAREPVFLIVVGTCSTTLSRVVRRSPKENG